MLFRRRLEKELNRSVRPDCALAVPAQDGLERPKNLRTTTNVKGFERMSKEKGKCIVVVGR